MDANSYISKLDAIELLAERDVRPHEDMRSTKSRTVKRIESAVERGLLIMHPGKRFILGELIGWAKSLDTWAGKLDAYPAIVSFESQVTARCEVRASLVNLPDNLPDCQKRLLEALDRVQALESEFAKLKPDADRYKEIRETNRINGKQSKSRRFRM